MGTDAYGLGRLQRLTSPREVWRHEAADFTPWLAANVDLLSDAIGLPLTVVGQEVPVGEFRLDIHTTDPDGRVVIIENQLEASDHSHLRQQRYPHELTKYGLSHDITAGRLVASSHDRL